MKNWVVFDIGGVLVRVARTWGEAMTAAGLSADHPNASTGLNDFRAILEYQADALAWEPYLDELQSYLGLESPQQAASVHNAILMEPMPGIVELILELKRLGYGTACLSNTNAVHWVKLTDPAIYRYCGHLDLLAASHLYGVEKPDPAIYRAFEAESGAGPANITFFDDGPANVTAAIACGWTAHKIDPFGETAAQMAGHLGLLQAPA